jgi:hypothetical protein
MILPADVNLTKFSKRLKRACFKRNGSAGIVLMEVLIFAVSSNCPCWALSVTFVEEEAQFDRFVTQG